MPAFLLAGLPAFQAAVSASLTAGTTAAASAAAATAAGSSLFASLFSATGLQALGLGLGGLSAIAGIAGNRAQLAAQRDQLAYSQKVEATEAARRDAERQQMLRKVLATNIAAAASAGLDTSGSVTALSEQSAREAAQETQVDRENVLANAGLYRLKMAGLSAQGRSSATAGLFSAGRDFMGALAKLRGA